jgi:hypothetical protein
LLPQLSNALKSCRKTINARGIAATIERRALLPKRSKRQGCKRFKTPGYCRRKRLNARH